ncbi:uncharacterized protein NDAI_0F04370 [Naumovozyma dairenensis CBS 421]|uniref:NADH:flavin oxidoreductase/NADH oxidase N-terminal domain-containing protein n=1 Tax=Naumovozyma dairenensis (strain ATCC 10597 / BCRC 20456 / CBS 421 / NBRC 0211 / NRRL Y-12639) TaxID=1071378 RepID=G0WD94_NAUDC|nr:hypothetical protein NDAI_0F04370 [Naumovozyma dairenensis CBS 421]CCD25755.1 hypothetical protein NDAI_0F04370 [Naumovozyma dairenensis CBS 421]
MYISKPPLQPLSAVKTIVMSYNTKSSVKASSKVPYFFPEQPILGKFIKFKDNTKSDTGRGQNNETLPPRLFQPFKIKNLTVPNRIAVSPMCLYSTSKIENYKPTNFHQIHYGALSLKGPGLIIVECTAVSPRGLITPNDLGLWSYEQAIEHRNKIVNFAHDCNSLIGIQLGYLDNLHVGEGRETKQDSTSFDDLLESIRKEWTDSAKLAIDVAKYDFIEIQGDHGHIFDSINNIDNNTPLKLASNDNAKFCLVLKIIDSIRSVIPKHVPLFYRMSASQKAPQKEKGAKDHEKLWDFDDTIEFAIKLAEHDVQVIDITGGFYNFNSQTEKINAKRMFMKRLRTSIFRKNLSMLVTGPENLETSQEAEQVLSPMREGKKKEGGEDDDKIQDFLIIGQPFLRNSSLVTEWADELNCIISQPVQYSWGFYPSNDYKEKK